MNCRRNSRAVMSLLQNFVLRSSIDRTLIGVEGNNSVATLSSSVALKPDITRGHGGIVGFFRGIQQHQQLRRMCTHKPPSESSLDQESFSKLNQLKHVLQSKNEYFEKYKDKFNEIETNSPKELLARLEQLDYQKKDAMCRISSADTQKPRSLNDVMHMDSLKHLERDDIIHLWQEFHRHKDGLLGAVMSGRVYDKMSDLASIHKFFVMPLPRTDGYEFFYMQHEDDTFHFTPLIMYQTHKDAAPVALKLINFTDLKINKDLVLLRGEYDSLCLSSADAHFLAVQTNFYFGETNESRLNLLKKFTTAPDDFNHMELIDELKNIQERHARLFELANNASD